MRLGIVILLIVITFVISSPSSNTVGGVDIGSSSSQAGAIHDITGAWKFISMEINLVKPEPERTQYLAPDWFGKWLFVDGHYSRFLEKTGRCGSACEEPEFEFEAFAGAYSFTDEKLVLRTSNSSNVFGIHRPSSFRVRITGNQMRLEGELTPIVEDMSEGTVTILLERIAPARE